MKDDQYEALWADLSDPMKQGLQRPEEARQSTAAALWKRGLLGPGNHFSVVVTELGEALLKWARSAEEID